MKVHSTGKHINEIFGLSDTEALELIEVTRPLWDKLVSGSEGDRFTVGDVLLSIANNGKFTFAEKYFLISHISRSFEVLVVAELFIAGDVEGFAKELGLAKK